MSNLSEYKFKKYESFVNNNKLFINNTTTILQKIYRYNRYNRYNKYTSNTKYDNNITTQITYKIQRMTLLLAKITSNNEIINEFIKTIEKQRIQQIQRIQRIQQQQQQLNNIHNIDTKHIIYKPIISIKNKLGRPRKIQLDKDLQNQIAKKININIPKQNKANLHQNSLLITNIEIKNENKYEYDHNKYEYDHNNDDMLGFLYCYHSK